MPLNSERQKPEYISIAEIANVFKRFFYSQPVYIKKMPVQKLLVVIKNEQDVEITRDKVKKNTEITFQGEAKFYPFLLQTKDNTFIVIGSSFSLYEYISRDPYLETKAEYQFQQKLRNTLKLTGGHTYYLPGSSSDFVTDDVSFEDVFSQDMSLRYEHDDKHSYLFVLV